MTFPDPIGGAAHRLGIETLDPRMAAYAARVLLAEHRPVALSDGDIVGHADDCLRMSDPGEWYGPVGASDPPAGVPREVVAAYYGPPCQYQPGDPPALYCAGCADASELAGGDPVYAPWPCYVAVAAAVAAESYDVRHAFDGTPGSR